MNSLAPVNARPLQPFSVDEARPSLTLLFAAYDPPFADREASGIKALMDAKVKAYLLGLQGIPGWAIEQTVTDFIQGKIERRRRDKLPTAEEIAAIARETVRLEAARQAERRARDQQMQEAREWHEKQAWLKTPEGQKHQEDRAKRAAEILSRASRSMSE